MYYPKHDVKYRPNPHQSYIYRERATAQTVLMWVLLKPQNSKLTVFSTHTCTYVYILTKPCSNNINLNCHKIWILYLPMVLMIFD